MATFNALGKLDLTILVSDFGVVQVIKNVLYAMLAFLRGFVHVSKDVSYRDDNIILSSIYQVPDVNPRGMFWFVTNGRYQIVNENMLNNPQDNVVTSGTTTSVANILVRGILMKEKPIAVSHDSNFYVSIAKSSIIDLCDSFNKDGPSPPNVVIPISVNS
jgi:hypothetical protein